MTPLDKKPARRSDLYQTTHNIRKTQNSMFPAGFQPTDPAVVNPRLRPRGYWDRPSKFSVHYNLENYVIIYTFAFQTTVKNCIAR
jgi:hypothetical protein